MKLVIDTNIIFSTLLKPEAAEFQILRNQYYNILYCQMSTIEIFKHKEKLVALSKLSEKEILINYYGILKHLRPIHEAEIPIEIRKQAASLCVDADPKDVVFVAASIMLDAYLWTGDKKLRTALSQKGYTNTISTAELLARH